MDYGMIGKIEKSIYYAEDAANRIHFDSLQAQIRGENNGHTVNYKSGKWGCDCDFFASRGVCSHTMAMERLLRNMVEIGIPSD